MDIEKELRAIAAAKKGNKEMALFMDEDGFWALHVGNLNPYVELGEVPGEFVAIGRSLERLFKEMRSLVGLEDSGETSTPTSESNRSQKSGR